MAFFSSAFKKRSLARFLVSLILLGAAIWFGWLVSQSYVGILQGRLRPDVERSLAVSLDRLRATTRMTAQDLARLATQDAPSFGSASSSLTIVEFIDFSCPYSRASDAPVQSVIKKYKDHVSFVVRDFPIEEIHPRAMAAALAARCAEAQGKYWMYHDLLFKNQGHYEDADLYRYASDAGLSVKAFQTCLQSQTYKKTIEEDLRTGVSFGVEGTPTFFFNGIRIQGALDAPTLEFIIQRFLAR